MMVMDSTIESTADVTPITPSQDGIVVKKKKKRRHSTAAKELPPLRLPPTASLELHQLSGMKRGRVPPLVIENSQAVKEESISQESDGGNTQQQHKSITTAATRVTLPSHLSNDVPRSKLDRITTASSTPDPDATITANLMSKLEHVATDTLLESGRSLLSDKLNSTGSYDSQLSQARLRRRDSRRGKLTVSQLLTDQSTVEQTPALELRPLPAGPLVTPPDGDRTEEAETLFNTEQSMEADTLHDINRNTLDDTTDDAVSDTDILGMTIHGTDCLLPDVNLLHPLIQVQLVDMATGGYIKKSDRSKSAVSYYETGNTSVDFVIPLQTQPAYYPNGIRRDLSVTWEEHLVINERLSHFTDNPNTILFFELLDFSNTMEAHPDRRSCDPGWYRVAWAFLKLVSSHGNPNTYKKCRLQLYRYPRTKRRRKILPQEERNNIEIYHIWSSLKRITYPSTIFVTIKGVCPPSMAFAVQRSMLPQQPEEADITYDQLLKSHQSKKDVTKVSHDSLATRVWKRLPGQTCQLPNQLVHTLSAGKMGCTALAFSHSGCQLAVCCYDNTRECAVKMYSIPDCRDHVRLTGHHGIIYHAHWSHDDNHLLTASQDTTVRHWDLSSSHAHHMVLPHPCFVYDAIYHTSLDHVILTAGYDKLVYIWTVRSTESRYGQCLHKMAGHDGYINTLCLNSKLNFLYSADHTGVFCKWVCPASHDAILSWKLDRSISLAELKDHVITSLELQPTNHNRLLICTQNRRVFLIDTNVLYVVRHYHDDDSVQTNQSVAVFSACGTYVLLGVGHHLTVCRANSGTVVGQYHTLPLHHPLTCLLFHPMDHIIALSAFGTSEPVLVYNYNKEVEEAVVELLEAPVEEETTPLPSSHDVMAQNMRLQKAVHRLGLVTQQSGAGSGIISGLESTYPSSVNTIPPKLTTTTGTLSHNMTHNPPHHPPSLHVPFSSTPALPYSSTVPRKAVVLHDYTSQQPNELSVQRGARVVILSNEDPHWWRGQIDNQEGYIPASYVAFEDTSSSPAAAPPLLKEKKFHSHEEPELHKSAVSVRGKKKVKHKLP